MATLGENLKARREAAGLSKAALARKAGISVETYSRIEASYTSPHLSTIFEITGALGITGTELLHDVTIEDEMERGLGVHRKWARTKM